jgi:catechol 2,3-dioxygenase-like lactoylglutathione lyase family enzyme
MQVIFGVADIERSREFYDRAFAWPRNPLVEGFTNYVEYLPPDGGAIGLYAREGYTAEVGAKPIEIDGERVSSSYLYLRVDDVDATVDAITAAGGRPLSALADRAWGERAAWFADPDRNVIAVAQRVPTNDPAAQPS